jgi:hypothetical protein
MQNKEITKRQDELVLNDIVILDGKTYEAIYLANDRSFTTAVVELEGIRGTRRTVECNTYTEFTVLI